MPYLFTDYNDMVGKRPSQTYWKELQDALNDVSSRMFTPDERTKLQGIEVGATADMTPAEIKLSYEANSNTNAFTDSEKAKLSGIESGANKYVHPLTHPPEIIVQDKEHRFSTDTEKARWNDTYTKVEVDNKFSTTLSSLDWKETVNTFSDLATTYPNPEDGWTANVKDTDYTYRYDSVSGKWIAISANAIPLASPTVDGKMSATDKAKLDGIEVGANKYILPVATTNLGGVKSGGDIVVDSNGVVSVVNDSHTHIIANVTGLQTALDGKTDVGHTHLIADVQNLQTALDNKSNIDHRHANATQTVDGFMSATDKQTLDNLQSSGTANQNAWSYITIGATSIAADLVSDTLEIIAGDGTVLTPDATNDKFTIGVALTNTSHGSLGGGNLHAVATQTVSGFMSYLDKTKLDNADTRYFVQQNNLAEVSNKDAARQNLGITVSGASPSNPGAFDLWVDLNS